MLHMTSTEGTGGTIKESAADFIVKEITSKGKVLAPDARYTATELEEEEVADGKFTTFVLQKKEWNTVQALVTIAKKVGHGKKSIGYAGTKDRISVSVQLASVYGTAPEKILELRIKDLSINGAWKSNGVEMGSNLGNAFSVVVENVARPENAEKIIGQLDGLVSNYFDRQRFGSRLNNAKIGLAIMRGDFEGAVILMLADTTGEENSAAIAARKKLYDEQDFAAALSYFPRYLKNEFYVMSYLSTHSGDYAGALRRLPRGISLMFIHAVQSLLFNMEVEERVRGKDFVSNVYCNANLYGFPDVGNPISEKGAFPLAPLIGYETKDDYINEDEREILEKLGITRDSFKIKSMPELSMRGSFRSMLAPVKDLATEIEEKRMRLDFSIPSGSYATVLINEITKSDELDLKLLFQ